MSYEDWRAQLLSNPLTAGLHGVLLTITTGIVTLVSAYLGISLFPAGSYPEFFFFTSARLHEKLLVKSS
ncbi:hypothetical protein ACFL35_11995, partial [Candidatus Riflebacteria bacterium]